MGMEIANAVSQCDTMLTGVETSVARPSTDRYILCSSGFAVTSQTMPFLCGRSMALYEQKLETLSAQCMGWHCAHALFSRHLY